MRDSPRTPGLARMLWAACVLEATARKAGNVHPHAAFEDLCYADFLRAAQVVAPWLARAGGLGVGPAIEGAVRATRDQLATNVNLGIILLLAPLAAVPHESSIADGLNKVLNGLTLADTQCVYRAIRLAQPGGLNQAPAQDVADEPRGTLLDVMRLAADRDQIAAQYATSFALVQRVAQELTRAFAADWEQALITTHLQLLADDGDSLISRKLGLPMRLEAQGRALAVLRAGGLETGAGRRLFVDFDNWLRADGHRRNPGATADLLAAALFVALREGTITAPHWLDDPAGPAAADFSPGVPTH